MATINKLNGIICDLISKVNEYGDKFKEVKNKKQLQTAWTEEYNKLSNEDLFYYLYMCFKFIVIFVNKR
jgi:predicted methyltransferase